MNECLRENFRTDWMNAFKGFGKLTSGARELDRFLKSQEMDGLDGITEHLDIASKIINKLDEDQKNPTIEELESMERDLNKIEEWGDKVQAIGSENMKEYEAAMERLYESEKDKEVEDFPFFLFNAYQVAMERLCYACDDKFIPGLFQFVDRARDAVKIKKEMVA